MLRRVVVVAILLSLLPYPPAAASHTTAVGVDGPDPDGAYTLTYDIHRDASGPASLALDVARTDADGTVAGVRDLGSAVLSAGTTRRDVAFLPAEGAGRYVVALVVDGARSGELSFDVDDAAASAAVRFEVPDEPTYLNLTNDTVNADGKTKSPGEALLTRGTLADANGLAELDALAWTIERGGSPVLTGTLAPPPNATSWSFEHRFDASPFEAANYTLRLAAMKGGSAVASVSRSFAIREVAPTFVSGALANVTPDETITQTVTVVLADKNGLPSHALESRVYRASTRVENAGFNATLDVPARLADADGTARIAYPLTLRVPERATPASYRVSIYADGALLGAMPFEVRALPTLSGVDATTEGARLTLVVQGTGEGVILVRLSDGNGSTTNASGAFANGTGALALDAPRRGGALTWNLTLHARAGGPALAWRTGNWSVPGDAPPLVLSPIHVRARLPAAWRVESAWPLEGSNATFRFARWDGEAETRIRASFDDGRLRVDAPADLPAGRYTGEVTLAWPNGSSSAATWSFDAGPWVELELGDPVVEGRVATIALHNAGGLGISRLVVQAEPRADVKLVHAGQTISPTTSGTKAVFARAIPAGDNATLRVELPDGPLRSGHHHVSLRVLARVDLG